MSFSKKAEIEKESPRNLSSSEIDFRIKAAKMAK
jgi:hypothetical protein